ncbi:HTH-like domain-containing protein [Treponema maltophilum]|jgi:hypothetical protein|uniref:HTH-like domain-containing protein n=1 Tax=Treponema maltophilum TaxID=51160 RepID=UPI0036064AA8
MTIQELATELSAMYNNAVDGEKAANIHLFGIKYAKIIQQEGHSVADIIQKAKLCSSYVTEINKGMNLAKYVIERSRIQELLDE